MELVELIRKARSVQCSDLHITAGDFVAVRRFGELKLLDIKPTIEETEKMLNVYTEFCQKYLAMPVVQGMKTESDKFAGAERTYCIEALMHDGKALQAGT